MQDKEESESVKLQMSSSVFALAVIIYEINNSCITEYTNTSIHCQKTKTKKTQQHSKKVAHNFDLTFNG